MLDIVGLLYRYDTLGPRLRLSCLDALANSSKASNVLGQAVKAWLDHIVLNVRDVDRSLGFYLDVVGLDPYRVEEYREGEVVFPSVRVNAETIIDILPPELWDADDAGEPCPNVDHFCLTVEEAEWGELEKRLLAADVEIEMGPMRLSGARGDGTAVYVRDPDGNRVELRYYA